MSAISSLGSDPSVFQSLQNLAAGQQTSQSTQTSSTASASGTDAASDASGASQTKTHGHHHHHGGGESGGLFSQVQSAVTSALQTAQADGTDSDPNQVIQNAITQVLAKQQGATAGTSGQTNEAAKGDGTSASAANGSSSKAAFDQLLESNGINSQQFQQDFQAAIQAAQGGGSTDPGSVLANFPPGSVVDTTA